MKRCPAVVCCMCADAVGIDPSAAAAAMPKPTAETIDSNRLGSEEGKNTPDVFVRKETVSKPGLGERGGRYCQYPVVWL